MNILVFAPHPDDEIIGCGGSIAKHTAGGHDVHVVYMTSGNAGSLKISKANLAATREKEAQGGLKVLGVKSHQFLRIPDGYVTESDEILISLVTLIRSKKPDCIYIPHKKDAHRDHKRTHLLVTEAVVRAEASSFQECKGDPWYCPVIACYEVWTPLSNIHYTEDISRYMDIKLAALRQHTSQISLVPYDDAVKGLNRYRGGMTGKGVYCECFQILRHADIF